MANRHGYPIWYELMTADPTRAQAFYGDVLGWTISDQSDQPGMDYRMIAARNEGAPGDLVGGAFVLSDKDRADGAFPTWVMYIGVEDVDATAAKIKERGGAIHLDPFDIPGAGRAAMVADPQGNPFYIMRGSSDEASTAFSPTAPGKCSWNELSTRDQAAGNAFYAEVFGWTFPERMPMGEMGDYIFAACGDTSIGATMPQHGDAPTGWLFYFRATDIDEAAAKVTAGGGAVHSGPHEVPGGDRIIVATDPEGVRFGVVAAAS